MTWASLPRTQHRDAALFGLLALLSLNLVHGLLLWLLFRPLSWPSLGYQVVSAATLVYLLPYLLPLPLHATPLFCLLGLELIIRLLSVVEGVGGRTSCWEIEESLVLRKSEEEGRLECGKYRVREERSSQEWGSQLSVNI